MLDGLRLLDIVTTEEECDWNAELARACDRDLTMQLSHVRANLLGAAELNPKHRVLELGAGYGALSADIAANVREVVAVEADELACRVNAARCRSHSNVKLVCADMRVIEEKSFWEEYGRFDRILLLQDGQEYCAAASLEVLLGKLEGGLSEAGRIVMASNRPLKEAELPDYLYARSYKVLPDACFVREIHLQERGANEKKQEKEAAGYVWQLQRKPFSEDVLLYLRYSNERSRSLAVATAIYETAAGHRYVRKWNCYPQGAAHMAHQVQVGAKLQDLYDKMACDAKHRLQVVPCTLQTNGIQLPYVDGVTLSDHLNQIYENEGIDALKSNIITFFEELRSCHTKLWETSEAFSGVFGNLFALQLADQKEYLAADISNIDLLFDNILVDGVHRHVIDYEWTFDFAVPLEFILYRVLSYYVEENPRRKELLQGDIYSVLPLNELEKTVFEQMEKCFQQYIVGDVVSVAKMLGTASENNRQLSAGTIYFDMGEGFSERNAMPLLPVMCGDLCKVDIPIPKGCMQLRVDPLEGALCVMQMLSLTDETGADLWSMATPNAPVLDRDVYFLDTKDPWWVIPVQGKERMHALYTIRRLESDGIDYYRQEQEKKRMLLEKAARCERIEASVLWKSIQPLKKLYHLIRK